MNTPLEIPGCVAWIESAGDSASNKLKQHTKKPQTVVFYTDHDNPDRETLLIYDRDLTGEELAALNLYLTQGTEQFDAQTKPQQEPERDPAPSKPPGFHLR